MDEPRPTWRGFSLDANVRLWPLADCRFSDIPID